MKAEFTHPKNIGRRARLMLVAKGKSERNFLCGLSQYLARSLSEENRPPYDIRTTRSYNTVIIEVRSQNPPPK